MGKRLFQRQIMNPTFDESWLQTEYDMIENMLTDSNHDIINLVRKQMGKLRDIDKVTRQLILKTIYPSSLSLLYTSLDNIQQVNTCLYENDKLVKYLCSEFSNDIEDENGMSTSFRQYVQIKKDKEKDNTPYYHEFLSDVIEGLEKPYHFIDFEVKFESK